MITVEEMLAKLDEVAEMSDMIGAPGALVKDDMWEGSGDFTDAEYLVLIQALITRFSIHPGAISEAMKLGSDSQLEKLDHNGYALYVLFPEDGDPILAIGQPGFL